MTEMEVAQTSKVKMLDSMNNIMKKVLERERRNVGIQVDEGELRWGPEHYLGVILCG